jgi:hypothetical protein
MLTLLFADFLHNFDREPLVIVGIAGWRLIFRLAEHVADAPACGLADELMSCRWDEDGHRGTISLDGYLFSLVDLLQEVIERLVRFLKAYSVHFPVWASAPEHCCSGL